MYFFIISYSFTNLSIEKLALVADGLGSSVHSKSHFMYLLYISYDFFPVQKICSILEFFIIIDISLGTTFFMLESLDAFMSQDFIVSHNAIWFISKNSFLSSIVFNFTL